MIHYELITRTKFSQFHVYNATSQQQVIRLYNVGEKTPQNQIMMVLVGRKKFFQQKLRKA